LKCRPHKKINTNPKIKGEKIMTLIKWKNNPNAIERFPFAPSAFTDFFSDFLNEDMLQKNIFKSVPAVNIIENANDFKIELAVPGMNKSDFKIEVDKGLLNISAEKKEEKKDENSRYTRKEFSYSSFKRSFTLPEHVEADSIAAEYNDGVLMLTLPKKDEAKAKAAKEIKIS
jgi:HSP20 family protein